jgi:hypothetical protein
MTHEPTIERLLEPSTVLSHALDFMETDLDADAYNVISTWVARAVREIRDDLASPGTAAAYSSRVHTAVISGTAVGGTTASARAGYGLTFTVSTCGPAIEICDRHFTSLAT